MDAKKNVKVKVLAIAKKAYRTKKDKNADKKNKPKKLKRMPEYRCKIKITSGTFKGAVVLVTHDPGAARALDPQRVIVLPDGTEDHWSGEYLELITLA